MRLEETSFEYRMNTEARMMQLAAVQAIVYIHQSLVIYDTQILRLVYLRVNFWTFLAAKSIKI